ncbi:ComEA family DNA-binding protein [Streptomycetaceae bacterium NBC_01309]
MSKSPNPQTASRLAALFPADAMPGRHAADAEFGPHGSDAAATRHAAAASETPPPGVPPPDPDPWAGVPEPVGGAGRGAAAAAPERRAAEPLPAATRFAATVSDRIPPGLKAFRIAVDGRVVAAVAALALLAIVIAGVGWWRSRPQSVAVPSAVAASGSGTGSGTGSAVSGATAGPLGSGTARPDPLALSASAALSAPANPSATTGPGPGSVPVSVHVVGRVAQPGLFALPAGSRVDDALKAAGGALPGTDLAALNLARVLSDGEQVPVGVPGATAVPAPAGAPAAAATGKGAGTAVVDLNTATAEQLEGLPGIGPVMAASILEWRGRHGRFTSVEQLREIRGIGERRFEELRPRVRV